MPFRKPQKKFSRNRKAEFSFSVPHVKSFIVTTAVLLFIVGQIVVFKGFPGWGFLLSLFAALGIGAMYMGWVDSASWVFTFPSLRNMAAGQRARASHSSRIPKKAREISKTGGNLLGSFTPLIFLRCVGVLVSLVLGGLGQYYWIQSGNNATLGIGSWYYLGAVILFVACLWPWQREGLKGIPLSFKTEIVFLGIILVLGAFLRVYQIATVPSGLFIDQGFQGFAALRILHEGWRPFYVEDIFHAYALGLYMLAVWFKIFGATEVTLRLFYVFICLVSLPLIYWTFRQLAGPRMALLTLFILSVMRWNIIFSRNGFPTVQLTLYIFGTLAFLLYGLKKGKWWPYGIAAIFFAAGFYTYQAFKVFPLLLLVYTLYELCTNHKELKRNALKIMGFLILSLFLTYPVYHDIIVSRNLGTREAELSIWPHVKAEHSLKPFWNVVFRTALMFNRQGDPNARHNLMDHRMLDDVSGTMMILGLAYALFRIRRRKYFYAVMGFGVMSLPCILSIDPAHANRMFGMTPFIAFLVATPLAALWGRIRAWGGVGGERVYLSALIFPLAFMVWQNFDVYFNKEAHNLNSWGEYSVLESTIGRTIAENGAAYDYFISPRYYNHYTVDFYGYRYLSQVHGLDIPQGLIPLAVPANRGLYFAVDSGRVGIFNYLKEVYPKGRPHPVKDPDGQTFLYLFEVPPEVWAGCKGLDAQFSTASGIRQIPQFPHGLPAGPYHAAFTGNFYVEQAGRYRLANKGPGKTGWRVDGKRVLGSVTLLKGFHPIRIDWDAPDGPATPDFEALPDSGKPVTLSDSCLTVLKVPQGMLAKYYPNSDWSGAPTLEQREPTPDFTNGNDFPNRWGSATWEGNLNAPVSGDYQFVIYAEGWARMSVDGKNVVVGGPGGRGGAYLLKGNHTLKLFYRSSNFSALVLQWLRPDTSVREVIPAKEFR